MTKTFLVTGGAGFIGSHLCEHFLNQGHRVLALDNFITGVKGNIKPLLKEKNFHFIPQDVSKPFSIKEKLDFVLHFASPASPPDYLRWPVETLKAGAWGTFHALELAKLKKAVFCLASTSEVYGDPLVTPQKENYWGNVNSVGPRAVYDEAKRFAEALTSSYLRQGRVNTKIVRIFNTYGERMRLEDGRVIPNFIAQALSGRPLTVYGDGSQTRSYCYVSDLVGGIEKMLTSKIPGPVNLGNPNEKSVLELGKIILELTHSKSKIVFKPLPVDDPKQRCPDITLAKKALDWEPEVSLKIGLAKTIQYFKKNIVA
jgi:dTDP-glucose 4,6-dehydratase